MASVSGPFSAAATASVPADGTRISSALLTWNCF